MLSKIFVFLAIITAIQDLSSGNRTDSFGWLLLSLAMPYCGYYGAKNRDRNMLCMFYSVNLVLSIMYILSILVMLMILSMVPDAIKMCDKCHSLVPGTPEYATTCTSCSNRHMQCGPELDAATHHRTDSLGQSETTLETDEVENRHPQSACDAWENLNNNRAMMYTQMLTCVCQLILACAAFQHGRRLASHSYFIDGGGSRDMGRQPPIAVTRVQTQPQVLQASVVPSALEAAAVPTLAPGEVMAGTVRNEFNPVAGATGSGANMGAAGAHKVVMATEFVTDDVVDRR